MEDAAAAAAGADTAAERAVFHCRMDACRRCRHVPTAPARRARSQSELRLGGAAEMRRGRHQTDRQQPYRT